MIRWFQFVVTAILVGCSNSSNDTEGLSSVSNPPNRAPAKRTRVIQVGDNWVWDAEETTKIPGDETRTSVRATRSISIVRANVEGKQQFARSGTIEQFEECAGKEVYNWMEYISQKPNRDLFSHGDTEGENGALRKLEIPTLIWPGRWSPNSTFNTEMKFDTGFTYVHKHVVNGVEEVDVPIGRVACWKIDCDTTIVFQKLEVVGVGHRTVWFAPQLGAVVKERWTSSEKYGREREGTFLLRSSTVPLESKSHK